MKIDVFKKDLNLYAEELKKNGFADASECFLRDYYGDNHRPIEVTLSCEITLELIASLKEIAIRINDTNVYRQTILFTQLLENSKTTIIKSFKGFLNALEIYIKNNIIDGWIYILDNDNNYVPSLVSNVKYYKANPENGNPAEVKLFLDYSSPQKESRYSSVSFFRDDIYNYSILEILGRKGVYKETQELKDGYLKHLESYEKYSNKIGMQFIDYSFKNPNGRKIVNDNINQHIKKSIKQYTTTPFFSDSYFSDEHLDEIDDFEKSQLSFEDFMEQKKPVEYQIPFHPYVKVYDIEVHFEYWILASNMVEYIYDKNVCEKLILPEDHKDLVDLLVFDADIILEDIVKNKSGGTAILCKGGAGLGKTLTAEVYSETIGKPLYSVHSGQLGTNPSEIDRKLEDILERAERWGAILLLDEADVYIRKRDNSMDHNAIVAAFLRKLERFNGIVFMTTNRSDDVDDAILSRCIAIIDYVYPKDEELFKIWKVLSTQYKIELSNELINQLVNQFDKISGRDIKEMLKLASKFQSQRGVEIDLDVFRKCSIFRGLKIKSK